MDLATIAAGINAMDVPLRRDEVLTKSYTGTKILSARIREHSIAFRFSRYFPVWVDTIQSCDQPACGITRDPKPCARAGVENGFARI
jgi:hypothetical protein